MEWSSQTQRRAFKIAAAAAVPALLAFMLAGRPAQAAQPSAPAAATAAPASLKLFADSTLVQGDRISVEVVGRGPDVVLIPGLASSRETYKRTAERLRGRYRLHLVQVSGFAGAPANSNASGPVVEPTKEAIDAYIVSAGLKKPAVVGHSLGGVMALELALDHPDHVAKVFIVDSLAFYSQLFLGPMATVDAVKAAAEPMAAQLLSSSDADFAKGAQRTGQGMATAPQDQTRVAAWSIASTRGAMVMAMKEDMLTDLRPRMGQITVPVTLIYEAPLKGLAEADYAPVPNKTLISAAPGAKHFIMYDDPTGFDAAIDVFLAR